MADSLSSEVIVADSMGVDSLVDSLSVQRVDSLRSEDSVVVRKLTWRERRAARAKELNAKRAVEREQRRIEMEKRALAQLRVDQIREHRRMVARAEKVEKRVKKRAAKGRNIYSDSMTLIDLREGISRLNDSIMGSAGRFVGRYG